MKKIQLGFNTTGNLLPYNRTSNSVALGKVRNTVGSITRKYNYCARVSEFPLYCTFDAPPPPPSGQYQIAVGDGIFYISEDFGITWEPRPQFAELNLRGIALSYDITYILAGGDNSSLYYSNNGGESYIQKLLPPKNWFNIKMSKFGQFQTAIGPFNQAYVSNNYGNTFSIKNLPGIGGLEASFLAMSYNGKYQSISVYSTNDIWISRDYGNTWYKNNISSIMSSGGNLRGIAMSGDGRLQTCINDSNGEIYKSINYGVSWYKSYTILGVLSPYYIAVSGSGRYQLYPDYGGNIWVSRDFGTSWTNNININGIEQATFGASGWYPCAISESGRFQTVCDYDSGNIYTSSDYGYNWFSRLSAPAGNWWGVFMT
jgi:photosystem II stability/assembly factor-like uncharacterized protein